MVTFDREVEVDGHLRVYYEIEVRVARGDLAVGDGRLMRLALAGRAGEALTVLFQEEDGAVRLDAAVGLHDVERARPSSGKIRGWARLRSRDTSQEHHKKGPCQRTRQCLHRRSPLFAGQMCSLFGIRERAPRCSRYH